MGDSTNIIIGGATLLVDDVNLGYIVDGVRMTVEADMWYGKVEGVPVDIVARRPRVSYKFQATLVEPTLANLKIAYDWSNTQDAGPPITLDFGGENFIPTSLEVAIYGYVPGGDLFTRMLTIDVAVVEPGGEMVHTDEDMTKIPVVFKGLWDEATSRVGELSDAAA